MRNTIFIFFAFITATLPTGCVAFCKDAFVLVTDRATGLPVQGAEVRLDGVGRFATLKIGSCDDVAIGFTDENGRFDTAVVSEPTQVWVSHPRYQDAHRDLLSLEEREEDEPVRVELESTN